MKEKKMKEKKIIWRQVRLGEVAELKNGYAFKSETYATGDYRIITIANVQNGYLDMSAYNTIPQIPFDIQRHQVLQVGDILVSMTGNVGRVCKVDIDNCLLNQRVGVLVKKSKDVADTYLYAVLNTPMFEQAMINAGQGAAQQNIGKRNIEDYCIPVPFDEEGEVDMEEQRRIAGILSDMDEEIRVKEELLAKHRALKQGVMQQLLSPDAVTLSPDVAGDATASTHTQRRRELVKLGEIGIILHGAGFQKADFVAKEKGIPCIHYGQIHTRFGTYTKEVVSYVSPSIAKGKQMAKKGDIIIATTSEDVCDVCKACAWMGNYEIIVSNDACFYRHNQDPIYMAYLFQSKAFNDFKEQYWTGTKVVRVHSSSILNFEFPIPDLTEQQRIAGILSDMDAEIGVQEEVIEKLKAVKQGVMQGLLNAQQRA